MKTFELLQVTITTTKAMSSFPYFYKSTTYSYIILGILNTYVT